MYAFMSSPLRIIPGRTGKTAGQQIGAGRQIERILLTAIGLWLDRMTIVTVLCVETAQVQHFRSAVCNGVNPHLLIGRTGFQSYL